MPHVNIRFLCSTDPLRAFPADNCRDNRATAEAGFRRDAGECAPAVLPTAFVFSSSVRQAEPRLAAPGYCPCNLEPELNGFMLFSRGLFGSSLRNIANNVH